MKNPILKNLSRVSLVLCLSIGYTSCAYNGGGLGNASNSRSVNGNRPNKPELKKLENGHYRVTKQWELELNGKAWKIQRGYTSNGITAPSYIKRTLGDGVDHEETWSAVFHDWLFTQPDITRQQADLLFRDILLAYGVSSQKANIMYSVVAGYSAKKEQE